MSNLVLVRHGRSQWNIKGLWTGWVDVDLSPEGIKDAQKMATFVKDIKFQIAFTSSQKRAKKTFEIIQNILGYRVPLTKTSNLWERHYGTYIGKNKWEMRKTLGDADFNKIRRDWNFPVPEGETLKDVYDRVVPYYKDEILPELINGKNVLVTASGNSLRSLEKYLDNLSNEQIADLEFGIGEVHVYQIDQYGNVLSKQIRNANLQKGKI